MRNSAEPVRPVLGRCQEASITPRLASPSSAASSAVVRKLREDMGLRSASSRAERDAHAAIDLAFFSIPVTEAWPISPVRATCVPPQGCRSKPSMAIRRTRPAPIGGLTDMVLVRLGLASSSASAIQRWLTAASRAISALSRSSMSALSSEVSPEINRAARRRRPPTLPSPHRAHDREQMKGSVSAHALVAQIPVDPGDHACARAGQGGALVGTWRRVARSGWRSIDDRKHRPISS